jgi:DNA repair exonuclease SbcCD ATPase subunit
MSLRIINLQAENYKGIKAIDITPKDDLVLITGANKQGKSSVLDAIFAVLCGGAASRVTQTPIRDGEDWAIITCKVGDSITGEVQYIVTRRWKDNDVGNVTVMAPDGAKYKSPQSMLDQIIGKLSFDPFAFVAQGAPEQIDTLVDVLGDSLPFDPAVIDRQRRGVFDRRTEVNRKVTELQGQLAQYGEAAPGTPDEEISGGDLLREADAARASNTVREQVAEAVTSRRADVERLRAELADAETSLASALDREATLAPEIDIAAIFERIDALEETNRKVRAKLARQAVADELSDKKQEAAQHTLKLAEIDAEKEAGIKAANMPIEGLSFNSDGVTLNGIPFGQCSTSEQLRASMAIAMAKNPDLRVLRIDKGESLDSTALALVAEMAAERDYQIWMSRVDESGTVGFVIEGGELAENEAVAA